MVRSFVNNGLIINCLYLSLVHRGFNQAPYTELGLSWDEICTLSHQQAWQKIVKLFSFSCAFMKALL